MSINFREVPNATPELPSQEQQDFSFEFTSSVYFLIFDFHPLPFSKTQPPTQLAPRAAAAAAAAACKALQAICFAGDGFRDDKSNN
jgi:hypothetical protein